jgi:NADH-quinone oxidoreductase subunit J
LNIAGQELPVNLLVFGGLASIAALCAVGVVLFENAVRSALCLVVNFFVLAFIYFTLNAEMLGINQIVVYTGAIMVLFLFVIMLLNLGAPQALKEAKDPKKFLGVPLGLALFAVIASQVLLPIGVVAAPKSPENYGNPESVGRALFSTYVMPFMVVSVLLLVGTVGSIILAKRKVG